MLIYCRCANTDIPATDITDSIGGSDDLYDLLDPEHLANPIAEGIAYAEPGSATFYARTTAENQPLVLIANDGVAWTEGDGTVTAVITYQTLAIPS
jgi:hypothetical protein